MVVIFSWTLYQPRKYGDRGKMAIYSKLSYDIFSTKIGAEMNGPGRFDLWRRFLYITYFYLIYVH